MILNREEIQSLSIINSLNEERLGNASYDLTIDKIITMDGRTKTDHYKIKSQEMVWVICKERFTMPQNLIGIAHVKTELTREGILSMNTGIIDPGYSGNISTLLINFGKGAKSICSGTVVLRVAFAEINERKRESQITSIDNETYFRTIRKSTDNFDSTFLNMSAIDRRLSKALFKWMIAIIAFIASIYGAIELIKLIIQAIKSFN